jgi:hypothetical protein
VPILSVPPTPSLDKADGAPCMVTDCLSACSALLQPRDQISIV